jgi:hypothetical protein
VFRYGNVIQQFNYSSSGGQWIQRSLGTIKPGVTIQAGTCGVPGESYTGDTYLHLVDAATGQVLAINDDACGVGVRGSSVVYTVPFERNVTVSASCWNGGTCNGWVSVLADDNANGVLNDVVAAFDAVPAARSAAFSTRVNDLYGLSFSSYHVQGFQRVPPHINPNFQFVFSVNTRSDAGISAWENNLVYQVKLPSRGAPTFSGPIGPNPNGSLTSPPLGDIADRNLASLPFGLVNGKAYDHSGGLFRSGRLLFNPNEIKNQTNQRRVFVFDIATGSSRPSSVIDYDVNVNGEAISAMALHKLQVNDVNTFSNIKKGYQPVGCATPKDLPNAWIRVIAGNESRHIFFAVKMPDVNGWVDIVDPAGWLPLDCSLGMWDGQANDGSRFAEPGLSDKWGGYQNLALLTDPTGNLYLVGGGNWDDNLIPDWLDLWQVHFYGQPVGNFGTCSRFVCLRKLRIKLTQPTDGAHLKWGGGIYIAPPNKMFAYATEATAQNGADGYLRLNEFGN